MKTIFFRAFKDRRILLAIYILASVVLLWMYIGLFPAFKNQSANLEQLLKSYPESFLKAFNFDIKNFTTLEGFLATEQFSFIWPLMMIFMLVGFAGAALSGEIEKGTMEILLANPLPRWKIFFGKYLAGSLMLLIFVAASIFAALPIARLYHLDFKTENFLTLTLLGLMFGQAILSLGFSLSSIFSERGKVFFVSGLILVSMYVLNILSAINENLRNLKYLSYFYYFNPTKAMVYNQIDPWSYAVFLASALEFLVIGVLWFLRKDI
ncbi:MAG TPA: ABC transporter permease subunit [Patescibacteria group bacterium]|nr:ABC transporter permease subunit [Patescibacteria group bacterium]